MVNTGELYRRLVLFTDDPLPPMSYHQFYVRVKNTVEEMEQDLPPSTIEDDSVYRREVENFIECWWGKI